MDLYQLGMDVWESTLVQIDGTEFRAASDRTPCVRVTATPGEPPEKPLAHD